MPHEMLKVKNAAGTVSDAIKIGRDCGLQSGYNALDVSDLMKPRLELVQLLAVSKDVFMNTQIMQWLITLWDDSDEYYYKGIRYSTLKELKILIAGEKKGKKQQLKKADNKTAEKQVIDGLPMSPLGRRGSGKTWSV